MSIEVSSLQIINELLPNSWAEIMKLNHRIIPAKQEVLTVLLEVVREPAGVFGHLPLFRPDGTPYIDPEDSRIISDFQLWATTENQKELITWGACEKLTGFTMVIPSATRQEALEWLYNMAPEERGYFEYSDFIKRLPEWITRLKWAYVPLSGECDLVLFVIGAGPEQLMKLVENELRARSLPQGKLVMVHGGPLITLC